MNLKKLRIFYMLFIKKIIKVKKYMKKLLLLYLIQITYGIEADDH